ncbi:uncharacterized protein [Spinacia oleracea]|uniref:CDT1 Geminin-binding domain-containing protein n=1 Tax=Spinacia oleracea TaxID=3562 RepID=A0ABM3RRU6_SPIOL|nr:uncharacterized protein LOC130471934 [Spinacia oleracea]
MGVDKPSLVVDLVSKSRSGEHPDELEDPLSGIPADVRSQIPAEVARRARSSGGKYYSNVVQTYRASSGSSSYSPRHPKAVVFPIAKDKGKDAAAAEDENVPATPHYSSKDRVAICRKVFKAVPAEYVASLPGRKTDAQFGAIQATLLDLFCRMEFCKSWKTRTRVEKVLCMILVCFLMLFNLQHLSFLKHHKVSIIWLIKGIQIEKVISYRIRRHVLKEYPNFIPSFELPDVRVTSHGGNGEESWTELKVIHDRIADALWKLRNERRRI